MIVKSTQGGFSATVLKTLFVRQQERHWYVSSRKSRLSQERVQRVVQKKTVRAFASRYGPVCAGQSFRLEKYLTATSIRSVCFV